MPANDTNPEPKVSEKARELAEAIIEETQEYSYKPSDTAERIQSSLSELLEAGREALTWGMSSKTQWYQYFAAILSKWEPPK